MGAVDPAVPRDNAQKLVRNINKSRLNQSNVCLLLKTETRHANGSNCGIRGKMKVLALSAGGSDEASRFCAWTGNKEIHLQALDFLEKTGHLTPETWWSVPVTSFKRLLGTPAVRDNFGVTLQSGQLKLVADEKTCRQASSDTLPMILAPARQKPRKFTRLVIVFDMQKPIPQNIAVKPTLKNGRGLEAGDAVVRKHKRSIKSKKRKRRDNLIPGDCTLSITDPRTSESVRITDTQLRGLHQRY